MSSTSDDWHRAAVTSPRVEEMIAFLEPMVTTQRQRRIEAVLDARLGSVTVLMDAPDKPHNAAAVMRTCDAFGVPRIHVVRGHESFRPSLGIAKGTERWVEVVEHASAESAVEALSASGHVLVGAHADGELKPGDLAGIERLALVMGNEHVGIREGLARACRHRVRIPMRGFVESLNVSVSAGILLSHATADRRGDLSPTERRALYLSALLHTIPRPRDVLDAAGFLPAAPGHPAGR